MFEGQRNGKFSQNGNLGHSCVRVMKSRPYKSWDRDHVFVHLGLNVSSSVHNCVCVVDGGNAMAANYYYYFHILLYIRIFHNSRHSKTICERQLNVV